MGKVEQDTELDIKKELTEKESQEAQSEQPQTPPDTKTEN